MLIDYNFIINEHQRTSYFSLIKLVLKIYVTSCNNDRWDWFPAMPSFALTLPNTVLTITGEQYMLLQTAARLVCIEHTEYVLICNEEYRFIAAEQMRLGGY